MSDNTPKTKSGPQRAYCFTINNPTGDDSKALVKLMETVGRYMVAGAEVGESGTPHLQGYVELKKPQRIAALAKIVERAHWEARRGTREQARDYCMKDGKYIESGDWKAGGRGSRNDLRALVEDVKLAVEEGTSMLEIMEENPAVYSRHLKFMEKIQAMYEKQATRTFREVDVEVYIGEGGCGKTRKAHEENPGLFTVNPEDAFPFDGYDGEKTILIDDFEGQMKYKQILKVLDGHQLRVNVKGSHRYARWTKVIITTNESPHTWYKRGLTVPLARRLTRVTSFGNDVGGNSKPPHTSITGLELREWKSWPLGISSRPIRPDNVKSSDDDSSESYCDPELTDAELKAFEEMMKTHNEIVQAMSLIQ